MSARDIQTWFVRRDFPCTEAVCTHPAEARVYDFLADLYGEDYESCACCGKVFPRAEGEDK